MSLQNMCPEPNLSHVDQEVKNYEILKDRGAETKVTPHSLSDVILNNFG